eukprot:22138-Prymnesium_polylepis.1
MSASPFAAIASIMMLRRCCQQSPRYTLYRRERSSSLIASHATRPMVVWMRSMTAAASKRLVQRAPLH